MPSESDIVQDRLLKLVCDAIAGTVDGHPVAMKPSAALCSTYGYAGPVR